jgi:hypothetical protein
MKYSKYISSVWGLSPYPRATVRVVPRDLHAPWFDFGYSAIDGHIFVDDDDDKPYLCFSRNGCRYRTKRYVGFLYCLSGKAGFGGTT